MAYYRMRPPLEKEDYANSCWAAALDSFSRVTRGVPTLRERDLASKFANASDGYLLTRTRLVADLKPFLANYGVLVQSFWHLNLPWDIQDRLRRSHVIILWISSGRTGHAVVVYGIDNWVMFMDPTDGKLHKRRWSDFAGTGYYLIWRP